MSLSVLVVDDEPGIRLLLKNILMDQGHAVYDAKDSATGLEQFYLVQPDLVLLDISMPGRNGFTMLKEIRRQNAVVGVLMVSALKQEQVITAVMASGADGYLCKPFTLQALLKEIQRVSILVRLRRHSIPDQHRPEATNSLFC
jgi:DNA-binding response OmpR family regulator